MGVEVKTLIRFSLGLLAFALIAGLIASFAYLYPGSFNDKLPFYQLRPMHVSAALFWIIGAAAAGILYFQKEVFSGNIPRNVRWTERIFVFLWISTVVTIFVFYAFRKFGGREYWEFPVYLAIPLLCSWLALLVTFFSSLLKSPSKQPLYVWMWSTGLLFFLITFLEQNLYQIPWFRESFLREVTVQWKSNGAMVGAWNQMIYGSSLFVMAKLSNNPQIAQNRTAWFFYFLGLTNLMFNWGHHIYNLPTSSWIRHVSYAISMTEWILLISIIRNFKTSLAEGRKFKNLISYRFISVSELWVLLNLLLAILMSVPAINRFTHGTHITVAHAMGATIGINTMILLASVSTILKIDRLKFIGRNRIIRGLGVANYSLLVFWFVLIAAGITKAYRTETMANTGFTEIIKPVNWILHLFSIAGIGLTVGFLMVIWEFFRAISVDKKKIGKSVRLQEERGTEVIY